MEIDPDDLQCSVCLGNSKLSFCSLKLFNFHRYIWTARTNDPLWTQLLWKMSCWGFKWAAELVLSGISAKSWLRRKITTKKLPNRKNGRQNENTIIKTKAKSKAIKTQKIFQIQSKITIWCLQRAQSWNWITWVNYSTITYVMIVRGSQ